MVGLTTLMDVLVQSFTILLRILLIRSFRSSILIESLTSSSLVSALKPSENNENVSKAMVIADGFFRTFTSHQRAMAL